MHLTIDEESTSGIQLNTFIFFFKEMLGLSCLESCDRIDLSLEKIEESLVWRNDGESIPVCGRV